MRIRPRNKRILVELEGTEGGRLKEITTKGGIHIPVLSSGNWAAQGGGTESLIGLQNRWAKVVEVGPKCTEIQVGDRVCIFSQKWTNAFSLEKGVWYWFSDEDEVLMVDMLYRETKGKKQTFTEDSFIREKMKGMHE